MIHGPTKDPKEIARRVDLVLRWGYYVVEFNGGYHVRIQDAVDFWPSTGKWRAWRGFDGTGQGLDSLNWYLRKHHPLKDDAEMELRS